MPATPLGSLSSLNKSSLHFLEYDSSTDENAVFACTVESNPSEMNSVNSNTSSASRMTDREEGNISALSTPVSSTVTQEPSSLARSPSLTDNSSERSRALSGAKFNVKCSQSGELQGVADMAITQCHSDTQEVGSFSLDLDLEADLSTVIKGNEKFGQFLDPIVTDALPGAKSSYVKCSQSRELQGVADMVITQCHSADTQEVGSFSLDLDLEADLSTVIKGNEKFGQFLDPIVTDALPGAKSSYVKCSQSRELQGVADMVITQCHSADTQEVGSFSLDLDLDADLSIVIEGNENGSASSSTQS